MSYFVSEKLHTSESPGERYLMGKVILTSFRDAPNYKFGQRYSIARWQPKGCSYPEMLALGARDIHGSPLRLLEPAKFQRLYNERLRLPEAKVSLALINTIAGTPDDVLLLCWCHPERQKGHATLYCHRILVGYELERLYPEIEVVYADGADKPVWERG